MELIAYLGDLITAYNDEVVKDCLFSSTVFNFSGPRSAWQALIEYNCVWGSMLDAEHTYESDGHPRCQWANGVVRRSPYSETFVRWSSMSIYLFTLKYLFIYLLIIYFGCTGS